MITLPRLSNSALALGLIFTTSLLAETKYCPKSFEVLERGKKMMFLFKKENSKSYFVITPLRVSILRLFIQQKIRPFHLTIPTRN